MVQCWHKLAEMDRQRSHDHAREACDRRPTGADASDLRVLAGADDVAAISGELGMNQDDARADLGYEVGVLEGEREYAFHA